MLVQHILEEIRDDFGSRPIFSIGVQDPTPSPYHALNSALCFSELARPLCDVFLPLSAPYAMRSLVDYRPQSAYVTSALLASAVDLCTHPFRIETNSLRSSSVSMRSFVVGVPSHLQLVDGLFRSSLCSSCCVCVCVCLSVCMRVFFCLFYVSAWVFLRVVCVCVCVCVCMYVFLLCISLYLLNS
jgi:hypothetical protein